MISATPHDNTARMAVLVKVWPKLSETFILEEVLGLERRGIDVSIYTLAAPSDELRHAEVAHVRAPVTAVPPLAMQAGVAHLLAHLVLIVMRPLGWLASLTLAARRGGAGWRDLLRAAWLARRLVRGGATRLHVHFIAEPADLAQMASRMAGLPWSISAHAKDIYLSRPEDLERKLLAAQFTVTCTEHNRAALAAIAPHAAVHRMYHGIDHGLFRRDASGIVAGESANPAPTRARLLAVGRLREKKGLDVLVDACALLTQRERAVDCDIVGYGEAQAALQARITAAGLDGSVRLVGKLARDAVIDSYRRCHVFVQPSRITADGDRDGIPNVMLEAMSMALPVVATRVSGIPEVLEHEVNGLLVEPDDPVALARAIERLLDDPALAARLGERARVTVQRRFDNDTNLGLLVQLMQGDHACRECIA